jgi:uncharacterized protein (DUF1330 family)
MISKSERHSRHCERFWRTKRPGGPDGEEGILGISYQSVSDPAAISEYAKLARTALEALGGRVIVADKPAKTHEAGVQQLVVVVEFENLEKAIAAYESDLYKPALKVFDNAAQRDFRIVEGR